MLRGGGGGGGGGEGGGGGGRPGGGGGGKGAETERGREGEGEWDEGRGRWGGGGGGGRRGRGGGGGGGGKKKRGGRGGGGGGGWGGGGGGGGKPERAHGQSRHCKQRGKGGLQSPNAATLGIAEVGCPVHRVVRIRQSRANQSTRARQPKRLAGDSPLVSQQSAVGSQQPEGSGARRLARSDT